jgi:type I restriction enzyme S subunit
MVSLDEIQLGDLLEKLVDNRGKTPPLADVGVELIETTSLTGGGKFPDYSLVRRRVSQNVFDNWFRSGHPRTGDILVATVGANIGSAAIMRESRGCVAQNLVGLRVNPLKANPDYVYYYLSWNQTQSELKRLDIGAAQPSLKVPHLLGIQIPLFPLNIQQRIAEILSAYDELIENSQQRIKILESMARALYREWFVYFRYPGHESSHLIPSSLGDIPQGWDVRTVGEITKRIQTGKKYDQKTVSKTGAVPVLDQGKSGIIGYHDDQPGVEATEHAPVIVFANHTCYQRLVHFSFSTIQNVLPFIPHPSVERNIYWLHWATNGLVVLNDYKGHWPQFAAEQLVVPSNDVCQHFGEFAAPILRQTLKLETQIQNLRRTRDLLLPRLLSGQLDVDLAA